MPRRDDRRVQRTRKLLRESLLALILEKGYDDISIQEVTDHANLGRATFYLHYQEKDELLSDVMRVLFEEFLVSAPQFFNDMWLMNDLKPLQAAFEFADEHYDLYRIMTIGRGSITASRQLRQIIYESLSTRLGQYLEETGQETIIDRDFIENYLASSLIALIFWWLDSDMPYSPEEMASMFVQMNTLSPAELLRPAQASTGEAAEPKKARQASRKASKSGRTSREERLAARRKGSLKETVPAETLMTAAGVDEEGQEPPAGLQE